MTILLQYSSSLHYACVRIPDYMHALWLSYHFFSRLYVQPAAHVYAITVLLCIVSSNCIYSTCFIYVHIYFIVYELDIICHSPSSMYLFLLIY